MSCDACAIAAENPRTGRFNAGCHECDARSLAGGPMFHASIAANALTQAYRSALQQVFGADWKDGHAAVKRWADRIATSVTP